MKVKINVKGEAKLLSVYENNQEEYFAKINISLGPNNEHKEVYTSIDLPLSKKQYITLRGELENEDKDLADVYNDPTDRRPVLKVRGDLELLLNPEYRVGKIHNIKNGFPYWVDEAKIKRGMKK